MTTVSASITGVPFRTEIDLLGGHRIVADESESLGGANAGGAPYSLLLASLGACTAITLRMYADAKRWPLQTVKVDLQLSRGDTSLVVHRTLRVEGLNNLQKVRLAEVAERTPVTLTLKTGLFIKTILA
jgi:putative redox protein